MVALEIHSVVKWGNKKDLMETRLLPQDLELTKINYP